jgi:hypothetical protein
LETLEAKFRSAFELDMNKTLDENGIEDESSDYELLDIPLEQ